MPLTWADVGADTKLEPVLERWPELEQLLVEVCPSFEAFASPLLRRTFAKAASLRQVAQTAGVPVEGLLDAMGATVRSSRIPASLPRRDAPRTEAPAWVRRSPHARHDARLDVERGIHPLPRVLEELEALPDGEVYELLTPLLPAPLLGLLAKKGYEAHAELDEQQRMARTLIRRGSR